MGTWLQKHWRMTDYGFGFVYMVLRIPIGVKAGFENL